MAASWKLRYFFHTQYRCKQRNVKPHYSANQSLSLIHKIHYTLPTKASQPTSLASLPTITRRLEIFSLPKH